MSFQEFVSKKNSAQLKQTSAPNPLQPRRFKVPKPPQEAVQLSPEQQEALIQEQLEKASRFGYNGFDVPVNAPGTPPPPLPVQRQFATGRLANNRQWQSVPGVEATENQGKEDRQDEEKASRLHANFLDSPVQALVTPSPLIQRQVYFGRSDERYLQQRPSVVYPVLNQLTAQTVVQTQRKIPSEGTQRGIGEPKTLEETETEHGTVSDQKSTSAAGENELDARGSGLNQSETNIGSQPRQKPADKDEEGKDKNADADVASTEESKEESSEGKPANPDVASAKTANEEAQKTVEAVTEKKTAETQENVGEPETKAEAGVQEETATAKGGDEGTDAKGDAPEKTPIGEEKIDQEAVAKVTTQTEKVAQKQAEAATAVTQTHTQMATAASTSQQLANTGIAFAAPELKPTFVTTEEGIAALAPQNVLGSAGNGMVLYQTDNPQNSLAAAEQGIVAHPIPEAEVASSMEQQRLQAETAISQFMASGSERVASISSLGQTIAPRIQASTGQAVASVDTAISQNQAAITTAIATARNQVQSQGQAAKSQVTGQHQATIAAIKSSTTAARDRLQTEYQASLAQLSQIESGMAGRIAQPFNQAATDFRAAGVKVGQEAIQVGNDYQSQFAGESPPEPSNFITEFLESFDRDTYVQNWRQAKIKAAGDVAASYRDGLVQNANEKAGELSTSQSEVVKGMREVVATTRNDLQVKYTAALQELSQSEQSALQMASQTLNGQLQGIDQNLNATLGSLDQMQATQLTQLNSLGEQKKLGINANAEQVTAALQEGVNQATTSLQGAFQQFADQAQGMETPNLQVVNSVIAEAQGQLNGMMATTQTALETGINNSEQGIVQQAQGMLGSINTVGQQAAASSAAVTEEFNTSIAQEVQSATQAFTQLQNGHTNTVNGSADKTVGELKNLTAGVQQKLDGVIQNLSAKLTESVTQLENGLRGSLKGSDQNPSIQQAIADKAQEAADQVQPAWKSVVKILIDIVITVAVTVAIAALAASGVGLVAAIGLAALIGATGALVKQGANDLIDGKMSSWQTYAKQAGFGAVGGVLQLVGIRGADKAAGLLTSTITKTGAKFGIESLGEMGADISQRLAVGEQFSLAMVGVSFGTSLLGNAGGEALSGAFGKLGTKLGIDQIDNAAFKTGGEFVTDTIGETATDVTSQTVFEGKELSWQTVGESAGTSAFGNLAGRGANRAYGDRLRNLGGRDRTSTNVPNLDQPLPPVGDISTPTPIIDPNTNQPVGQAPVQTPIIDPNTNQPVGQTPVQTPIIDPNTNQPIGEVPEATTPHRENTTQSEDQTFTPEDRKPSSPTSQTSPTQDTIPSDAKADSPETDKVEVDETSVVAQQTTHDGHQLKVLEDGSVVRCSQCEVLELRYKHLFERKTEYSTELQTKLNDLDARIKTIRERQQQENTNKAELDTQLAQIKEDLRSIEAERYNLLKSKERAAAERFEALKAGELDKAEKGGRQMSPTDLRQLREIQGARLQELFVNELDIALTNEEVRGMVGYATKKTSLKPEILEALVRKQKNWNEVKNKFVEYPHLMRQIIEQRARVVDKTFNDAIDDLCTRPEDYTQDPTLIERLETDEGKESLKQVKLLPIGSKDLTSDYDATVVGKPGDASLEILAVIAFNKKFKQEWSQESGTVFDTNVYTTGHMPASSLSNRGQQYSQMNAVRSNLKDIEKLQQKLQKLREGMDTRTTQTARNKARRMERQVERLISEKQTEIREILTQINNLRKNSGEEPISANSLINAETTSAAIKTVDSSLNTLRTDLKGKIDAENETQLVGLTEDALGQMARDQQMMSLIKMKRFMTDAEWQQYSDMMREAGVDEALFAEAKTVSDALGQKLHDRKDSLPDTVRDAENHAANRLYEETLAELIPNLNRLNELREKYKGQELETIPPQDLLEIQTLNIQANKIQSQALFFANEAYHTGGPVGHVVLNQQMRLGLEVEAKEFSLSVNEQTGFIMEQTEHVKSDKDFGKSLWKSAKYLDRICDAAEKLGEIESRIDMLVKDTKIEEQIEAVDDPDVKEVYKLREIAVELLKIKKNPVMNDAEKSAESLKIVEKIGWTNVEQYRQKMLQLNRILNERIQAKINDSET